MPQFAVLLALIVVPVWLLLQLGAGWKWILLGGAAWIVAVVVKAATTSALKAATRRHLRAAWVPAAVSGTWSALCELGAAALVFRFVVEPGGVIHVVGFGVGAGVTEVALLIVVPLRARGNGSEPNPNHRTPAPADWFVAWSGVSERFSTICGHIGSRGLVWLGLQSWVASPAVLFAVATFALVDGVADYGYDKGWNWLEPRTCRRFQGFVALVGAIEIAAFTGLFVILGPQQ